MVCNRQFSRVSLPYHCKQMCPILLKLLMKLLVMKCIIHLLLHLFIHLTNINWISPLCLSLFCTLGIKWSSKTVATVNSSWGNKQIKCMYVYFINMWYTLHTHTHTHTQEQIIFSCSSQRKAESWVSMWWVMGDILDTMANEGFSVEDTLIR